jgi:CHAT domain-containing protein
MKFRRANAFALTIAAVALLGAACRDTSSHAVALTAATPPALAANSLDSAVVAAESLYFRAEYDSARRIWRHAAARTRAAGDSVREARVLTWLGLAAWRVGEYAEARQLGEQALALKLRAEARDELGDSYNALGLLAWNEGRLTDATTLYQQAIAAARAAADTGLFAVALNNLGLAQVEFGEFAEARRNFEASRAAAHTTSDPRREAFAVSNLGMLLVRTGEPRPAVPLLAEARRLFARAGNPTGELHTLGQLGTAYLALGDPRRALAALDSALQAARARGLRQEEASDLEQLAEIHRQAGDLRRALQLLEEARAINTGLGLTVETGAVLRTAGEIALEMGDVRRAAERAHAALRLHQDVGARYEQFLDHALLAQAAATDHDAIAAGHHLQQAGALVQVLGAPGLAIDLSVVEARAGDLLGRPRAVLAAIGRVRPLLVEGHPLAWEAFTLAAHAHAGLGSLDSAEADGRRAIAAVEAVRGRFASGILRTAYLAHRRAPYRELVEVLLHLGRASEAFTVADAARGRELLERLTHADGGQGRNATEFLTEGEQRLREIDELVERVTAREREAAEGDSSGAMTLPRLRARLAAARSLYEQLIVRAAESDPRGSAVLGVRHASAAEVAAALVPGEALVEYLIAPSRTLAFLLVGDSVRVVELPVSGTELRSRVRLVRDLVGRPRSASDAALEALHALVVAPLLREPGMARVRRLVIVRDEALGHLPFAALRNRATGRYLVEEYALSYLPSAGALPALRQSRPMAAAAKGAPVAFAPFSMALPATRREVEAVRGVTSAAAYLDGRATEPSLRRSLAVAPVVHVASHGVLNAFNPMFSRIEVTRGSGSPNDDGRLEVHEVLGIRAAADLVYLSGCETGGSTGGATTFVPAEEYATLAQAFLYAGARNVVATLWRVEDESAAAVAERFYRYYQATRPAEALALAQRDVMRDPRYGAPYYWAGYELSGAGEGASLGGASVP